MAETTPETRPFTTAAPPGARPRVYGISGSRALRALWCAEETGIDFEHVPVDFRFSAKSEDYLAVNPNGRVPALVDGEVRLFESMAINLHLCRRYGRALYPANPVDEALTWQWSVWAISEIEPLQMQIVVQKLFTPEDRRDPKVVERAARGLQRPLKVLDRALADRAWLVGDAVSVADLNVASVMHLFNSIGFTCAEHAQVQRWLDACWSRPALARALARP